MTIVVPADDPCPSVAGAQRVYDRRQREAVPPGDERVEQRIEKNVHPAATVCWYRAETETETPCNVASREELLDAALAHDGMVACDDEGMLYGVVVESGMDCPESVVQANATLRVTSFVGADEYSARNECIYETSYDTTCGGGGPGFGLQ